MTSIAHMDRAIIAFMRRISGPLSRLALFTVYVWFGALKVFGESPATPLVLQMQHMTLPFVSSQAFLIVFGLLEIGIGFAFVIPRAERAGIPLMFTHMVATALPLILLPHMVWTGFLVPTLEGQYIIKNIALVAVAISIAANLDPLRSNSRMAQG